MAGLVAAAVETAPSTTVGRSRRALPKVRVNAIVLWLSVAWIALVGLAAVAPGVLASEDPTVLDPERALAGPGAGIPLGADHYGRSVAALLVHGARTALVIGLLATALGFVAGGLIGLVAGYLGGWVDMTVGRVMDMFMAFPGILLALVVTAALGATTTNLILAVGISTVPAFYRVMRGQVMAVRGRLFVEAARSAGFRASRIVLRHVLPNSLAPVVVLATVTIGTSIVLGASLSFLGLGPRTEIPDWGQLLAMGQPYLSNAWWISTFPGIALTLTVIAVSLLGDWLRDRLDAD